MTDPTCKNVSAHLKSTAPFGVRFYIKTRFFLMPTHLLVDEIDPACDVLDIGCGYGHVLQYLHFNGHRGKLIGADLDQDKLKIGQTINPAPQQIQFVTDFTKEVPPKSIDTVILSDVLYLIHEEGKEKLIRDILLSLKQGGTLLIKTTDPKKRIKFAWTYFEEVLAVIVLGWTKAESHKIYFIKDLASFSATLQSMGLAVTQKPIDRGYAYPHTLLVCRKN